MKFFKILAFTLLIIIPQYAIYADNIPMYEEETGRADITMAILRPRNINLSADDEKYLDTIQDSLNSTFSRFSAIQLFDKKNLEVILEKLRLPLSGNYSESDYIKIGESSNSNYIFTGDLTKTETELFILNLSIIEGKTGKIYETFNKTVALEDITNSNVCRAAAAQLLPKLGVILTAAGVAELNPDQNAEETENVPKLAYDPSPSGSIIEALIYSYFTSPNVDKNLLTAEGQTENSFKTIGETGTIIIQDIERRLYWQKNLLEFERFFRNHPPFELVYTMIPVQKGLLDYVNNTVDLEFNVGLRHESVDIMQKVLRDILNELKKTDYIKNNWGFDKWPAISAESTNIIPKKIDFLNGYQTYNIHAALYNNKDEIIGEIDFPLYGQLMLTSPNTIGAFSTQERRMVFTVGIDSVTEDMKIRIISINDVHATKSNTDMYIKNSIVEIMPSKSRTSISKKNRLLPELPEEKEIRLAIQDKKRRRQILWDANPLQTRIGFDFATTLNPVFSNASYAFELEAGLGFGYKNFSIDGRFFMPMGPLVDNSNGVGVNMMFGFNFAAGYSFVWTYMLLGFEGGISYYWDKDNSAVMPTLEIKYDYIPNKKGFAFRLGYRFEFGSPDEWYFKEDNSFGGDSVRMVGKFSFGIVIWK